MPSTYPRVTVRATHTVPHNPGQRILHFKTDRPGHWLVRAWMTASPVPTHITPAGAPHYEFVTDLHGESTQVLESAVKMGWFCQAAVFGQVQLGTASLVPASALLIGPSAIAVSSGNFLAWANAETTNVLPNPANGSSLAYVLDPPVSRIVIAFPRDLVTDPADPQEEEMVFTSLIQQSTGINLRDAFLPVSFATTFKGIGYLVFQHAPYLPWTNEATYTVTI
jgi:hypothetical protein